MGLDWEEGEASQDSPTDEMQGSTSESIKFDINKSLQQYFLSQRVKWLLIALIIMINYSNSKAPCPSLQTRMNLYF